MASGLLLKIRVDDKGNAKIVELNKNIKGTQKAASDLGPFMKKAFTFTGAALALRELGQGLNMAKDEVLKFEQAMARISGIGEITGKALTQTNSLARELAKNTEYSASAIASSMLEVVKMGFKAEELKNVMPTMLNLASAAMMDLNYAATNTISTMNQFGMDKSLENVNRTANVLGTVLNATGADAEDFMESMKYAGSVADQTGMSFEETSGMIGILADAGIKGSMAGTVLRQMFLSLMRPTDAVKKGLQGLNINGKTLSEVLLGLRDNGLGVIDFLEQFDQRAITGALALADPEAVEKMKELNVALLEQAVKVKDVADLVRDNMTVSLAKITSNFNEIAISLFDAFGDRPKDAVEGIIDSLQLVDKWVDSNQEGIKEFGDIVVDTVEVMARLGSILTTSVLGNLDKFAAGLGLLALGKLTTQLKVLGPLMAGLFSQPLITRTKVWNKELATTVTKTMIAGKEFNILATSISGMVSAMSTGILVGTTLKTILEGIADHWSETLDRDNANKNLQTTKKGLEAQLDLTERLITSYNKLTQLTGSEDINSMSTYAGMKPKEYEAAIAALNQYLSLRKQYEFKYGGKDNFDAVLGSGDKMDKWARNLRIRLNAMGKMQAEAEKKPDKKPAGLLDNLSVKEDTEAWLKMLKEKADAEGEWNNWLQELGGVSKGEALSEMEKFIEELQKISDEEAKLNEEAMQSMTESYWSMGASTISIYETVAMKKQEILIEAAEKEKQIVEERFDAEIRAASGSAFHREMAEQKKAKAIIEADKKVKAAQDAANKKQRGINTAKATADMVRGIISTIAETPGPVWTKAAAGVSMAAIMGAYLAQLVAINYRDGSGGVVTGRGNGTSDSVPALLSKGERVLSNNEVDRLGGNTNIQQAIDRGVSFNSSSNANVYIDTVIGTKQFTREYLIPELKRELAR